MKSLASNGNLFLACAAANMTRRQVMALRRSDPDFAEAYDEAMDEASDRIEAEVWRRAFDGVDEPLIKAGKLVKDPDTNQTVMTRRFSDPLLVLLLKASKPEKYQSRVRPAAASPSEPIIEEIAGDDDPPRLG